MSTSVLFGAGAVVTFITLWGVVMAGGLFVTRHEPPDAVDAPQRTADLVVGPVVLESERSVSPASLRVVDG